MRVSVCVVTNRPHFARWLVWNYERQTYQNTELVIVGDARNTPATTAHTWWGELQLAPRRADLVLVPHAEEATLGALFNLALEWAQGELVVFWGDDDWHHPSQIETLVSLMERTEVPYAGWRTGHFLQLCESRVRAYHGPHIFPAAGIFRRDKLLPFDDEPRSGVDTRWMNQMRRKYGDGLCMPIKAPHSLFLDHGANVSRKPRGNGLTETLPRFVERVKLSDPNAWGETDQQLDDLRRLVCSR